MFSCVPPPSFVLYQPTRLRLLLHGLLSISWYNPWRVSNEIFTAIGSPFLPIWCCSLSLSPSLSNCHTTFNLNTCCDLLFPCLKVQHWRKLCWRYVYSSFLPSLVRMLVLSVYVLSHHQSAVPNQKCWYEMKKNRHYGVFDWFVFFPPQYCLSAFEWGEKPWKYQRGNGRSRTTKYRTLNIHHSNVVWSSFSPRLTLDWFFFLYHITLWFAFYVETFFTHTLHLCVEFSSSNYAFSTSVFVFCLLFSFIMSVNVSMCFRHIFY